MSNTPPSPAVLFVSGRQPPPYALGAWVRRRGGRPLYAASLFEASQAVLREAPVLAVVLPDAGLGGVLRLRRLIRRHRPSARILAVDPRGPGARFLLRILSSSLRAVGAGFSLVGGGRL